MAKTRRPFSRVDVVGLSGPVYVRKKGGPRQEQRFASQPLRLYVYNRDGGQCQYCGRQIELDEAQIDHIHPWVRGGRTEPRNFVLSCRNCNGTKSAQDIPMRLRPKPSWGGPMKGQEPKKGWTRMRGRRKAVPGQEAP